MRSYHFYIRKSHRYLGLFIGIQFLLWTFGGLYFSWTNINHIHGDHLIHRDLSKPVFPDFVLPLDTLLKQKEIPRAKVLSVSLMPLRDGWYYEVKRADLDKSQFFNATSSKTLPPITRKEALQLARTYYRFDENPDTIQYITEANIKTHLDYRNGEIPAWGIHYNRPEDVWLYINATNHRLEKVRTGDWKIFDFLWMLHIMDFNERDNINNTLLRIFSVLGLLTIVSGFLLFFVSSGTIRKWRKKVIAKKHNENI